MVAGATVRPHGDRAFTPSRVINELHDVDDWMSDVDGVAARVRDGVETRIGDAQDDVFVAGALMSAAYIYRGVALLRSERADGAW